jgi:hypothetical protein
MRTRIKEHVRIKAGELVPHELNPRIHSEAQQRALQHLYDEIGFARSLLGYRLPDGRIKLIDGHLRQSLTPDEEVVVEVLDVTDEEARTLLLSIDPLAQLADYDTEALDRLREITSTTDDTLHNLWASLGQAAKDTEDAVSGTTSRKPKVPPPTGGPSFAVLVECENERSQIDMLKEMRSRGLKCKALVS